MRTLIYVHETSSVAIEAKNPHDADFLLCRYNRGISQVRAGTQQLEAGIYLIVSHDELQITGDNASVVLLQGGKDVPPEPRLQVIALEPGATAESIKQFIEVAKGITVGSAPVTSVSPGTSKIKNDPDGI